MDLADKIIAQQGRRPGNEKFEIEDAPRIVFENHPSIYRVGDKLFCGNDYIRYNDKDKLYALLDRHDARLTTAQAIWLYNRIMEMAPELDSRYIQISGDYLWNTETCNLVPIKDFGDFITTNDKRMREKRGRDGEGPVVSEN